jgi:serine/threonine protein kinase
MMHQEGRVSASDDRNLSDLLLRWEELQEQGRDVPAEELAGERAELLEELRRQIGALKAMRWMNDSEPQPETTGLPSLASTEPPADTATPQRHGVLAGRYRLDRLIAEGGFGHVWQGYDLEARRRVAVKVAKPHRVASADQRETFLEEARKAAGLTHPGIVAVLDVGQEAGAYFIVSDLVEGTDLAGVIRQRRPSHGEAARIVAEVARQLHHAHEQGIIHRDMKPANILVDGQGRLFITDFGIAVTQGQLLQRAVDCSGTLAYMAPEQAACDSRRIDARTDVYSLGVILHELLTGAVPFRSRSPERLREQVLYREPRPLRQTDATIPEALERICLRCLAKEPSDRYRTASDLADDLEAYLRATGGMYR